MRKLLAPAAVLLTLVPAGSAYADRYVAPGGNDAATCSEGAPCLTIQNAVGKASPGETIHIAAGTYAEPVSAGTKLLHFAGAGAGAGGTVISGQLRMQGGGSVRNLRVEGTSLYYGMELEAGGDSASYVVEDTVAVGSSGFDSTQDRAGLRFDSTGNTLEATVRRTTVLGGSDSGTSRGPAVEVAGAGALAHFEGADIQAPGNAGITALAGGAVTLTGSSVAARYAAVADNSPSFQIARSRLTATAAVLGVQSGSSSSSATVTDSALLTTPAGANSGVVVSYGNAGRASSLTLRRSTVLTTGPDAGAAVEISGGGAGTASLDVASSVLRATTTGGGTADDVDILRSGSSAATITASHSSFTDVTGDGIPAPGSDTNIAGDPQLDADGRLLAGSPLIDRGDATGLDATSLDLDGNPRSQDGDADAGCTAVPDIGAYERAAATCAVPPPLDTVAPVIANLSIAKRVKAKRRPRLRFTLSEDAAVTGKVQRRVKKKWRTVKTLSKTGKAGKNTIRFRAAKKRGRYRAVLRATDAAGNVSQALGVRFRIVRARKR